MAAPSRRVCVISKHVFKSFFVSSSEIADYEKGQHWKSLPDSEHSVHLAKDGPMSATAMPTITFPQLLAEAAKFFSQDCALAAERPVPPPLSSGRAPSLPWDMWKKWSWGEYYRDARLLGKSFIILGLDHFGSVSIFGFNSPEWMIATFGAMLCGAKYVGIYSTDTPEQVHYKVAHSSSAVLVIDGKEEFDTVASKVDDLQCLQAIIVWGIPSPGDIKRSNGSLCRVMTFEDCLEFGGAKGNDQQLEQRMDAQKPGHALGIIYTSGTTGNPKAVMIHHDALIAQGAMTSDPEAGLVPGYEGGNARIISYLPLSHIAGSLMDIFLPVYFSGKNRMKGTIFFARPYDLKEMTLALRIQFVRPTVFLAVPRVYEKMQARMMEVGATITGVKRQISTWAKGKGLQHARNLQVGGSGAKPFLHGLADNLILSKARDALGLDKCKVFLTGAAPISVETLEYFAQLGMMIQNVYGMSECAGVATICTPRKNLFGTVGHALSGLEVNCFKVGASGEKIVVPKSTPGVVAVPEEQQGEICFRGRHVMMGYMANSDFGQEHVKEIDEKNRSAIDEEGWLHSGDKGCIDTNGMVRITGRYKEIIIGSGGENIAPVPVEDTLKLFCPALSNVMMVGDKRKYNVALVTLQAEGATGEFPGGDDLTGAARQVSRGVTKISQAMQDPVWRKYIQDGIDRTNDDPRVCPNKAYRIQKFAIVPRDFSIQTGELTATLKLRRSVAEEVWADLIDSLYRA
eukprot:TRINITY_DN48856_c0_g1_i1.p1 TRINITY_DN48856_c0_g1~~TRINITY_DN48856_c0_g1_i1.p1  ORF type:complete len:741 (+),score=113.13 TRINITY_DN48856_c0_g1_i1:49-2271(+)